MTTLGAKSGGFEYLHDGKTSRLPMAGPITVNGAEAYQAACLAGLGIVQAPLVGMHGHLQRGTLVSVLPGHPAPAMPITLLYAHRRHLPRRVRVVMDWMAQGIEGYVARIDALA
ncbi:hypothetical protein AVHM3334_18300 [Acidovorax sp. SUPP3334]|nr:hypothetical protein AVHM3334_18300 [Acidovorax sp. SUPP3334]